MEHALGLSHVDISTENTHAHKVTLSPSYNVHRFDLTSLSAIITLQSISTLTWKLYFTFLLLSG